MTIDNTKTRFSDADWFELIQNKSVLIGGLGSLGSWLSLYISRSGAEIIGYDMDTVDEVNLAGQFYNRNFVEETKATALSNILNDFSPNSIIEFIADKYVNGSMACEVMFSCFDNMEARKAMFNNWCNLENKEIFIDSRLTAETFEVFVVTPDRIEDYKKTLFTDGEADELPCSFKSTTHVAAMAAGIMFNCFTNYLTNLKHGFNIRELPFKIHFSAQLLMLEIEQNEVIV